VFETMSDLKANEMRWQPIETAPRDGTEFLGSGWNGGIVGGKRHYGIVHCAFGEFCGDDEDERFSYLTHWMPLPEPPK
jgi:hypothetical protein